MAKLLVALAFLLLNFYTYNYFANEDFIPERGDFVEFPLEIDSWRCSEVQMMSDDVLRKLGVTDYLLCDFFNPELDAVANVYVGYHERQTRDTGEGDNIIHPPEHCLPGAGWDIIKSDVVPLDMGFGGEARRVIVAKGNQRNLVYFWYQSRGRTIARNHEKVLYMFVDRALTQRTDGSLVRFTVPVIHGDEQRAEEIFQSLAMRITPLLPQYIPN
ncbi:MAG: EpsI family protein [Myxococcota bacterium]|jgi:EpsI family protein|nr:EpsI family protein [Myxococcota bacterium]